MNTKKSHLRKKTKITQMEVTELLEKLENSLYYKMRFREFDSQCNMLLLSKHITRKENARLRENRRKQGKSKNAETYARNERLQRLALYSAIEEQKNLKQILRKEKIRLEAEIEFYKAYFENNNQIHECHSLVYTQTMLPIGSRYFGR